MLAPEAWEARWRAGDTGWDLGEPSPPLCWLLQSLHAPQPGRVLVPGCGGGHELLRLAEAGFQPVGWDLAPSAVALAQTRLGERGAVICGDVLRPGPPSASFDGVFEQTCFCAIDPAERPLYAAMVARVLRPGGWLWMVHLRVQGSGGPPFDSDPQAVVTLFAQYGLQHTQSLPLAGISHPRREGREQLVGFRRA